MIKFAPKRGTILMCDFDIAHVPPEMRKVRRVVVVSPRSYNAPRGSGPGLCIVVPFSATAPSRRLPSHVDIPVGRYAALSVPVWAIANMATHVSHARLDRVKVGRQYLSEEMGQDDMARVSDALRHAMGLT